MTKKPIITPETNTSKYRPNPEKRGMADLPLAMMKLFFSSDLLFIAVFTIANNRNHRLKGYNYYFHHEPHKGVGLNRTKRLLPLVFSH